MTRIYNTLLKFLIALLSDINKLMIALINL